MDKELMLMVTTDSKGQAVIHNKEMLMEYFRENPGSTFLLSVKPIKDKATNKQLAFYWAVIIPRFRHALLESGYQLTADDVHSYLKYKSPLMKKTVMVNDPKGIRFTEALKSIGELSKKELAEYFEWCAQYGAQEFSILIE